jgi:hypothetical protein
MFPGILVYLYVGFSAEKPVSLFGKQQLRGYEKRCSISLFGLY